MPDTATLSQPHDQRTAEAPDAVARPPRELRRVVAADATPRRLPLHATMAQTFLRFDPTHELPHIVETANGHIVARFEKDADLAWFISRGKTDRPTLPQDYVLHLTGGQL